MLGKPFALLGSSNANLFEKHPHRLPGCLTSHLAHLAQLNHKVNPHTHLYTFTFTATTDRMLPLDCLLLLLQSRFSRVQLCATP